MHEHVTSLLKWGFSVVVLRPGGKAPAGGVGWQRRVITGGRFRVPPDANLGVLGGSPVRPGHRLVILDVDVKGGKEGRRSLEWLRADYGPLPLTTRAVTPSGGEHYYLAVPADVPLGDTFALFHRLGYPDIDLLGAGRFAVAPPSTVGAGGYDWLYRPDERDVGVALAPPWLVAWLRLAGRPEARVVPFECDGTQRKATDGHVPIAGAGGRDRRLLLNEVVTRYPVLADGSRNTQMSRAVASLAARGLDRDGVLGVIKEWHAHFANRFSTELSVAAKEAERSVHSLFKKVEAGKFLVAAATDHTAEQSRRVLTEREQTFLQRLKNPVPAAAPVLPYHGKEGQKKSRWSRLSALEEQFVECLIVYAGYERDRGRTVDDIRTTNQQLMALMQARFGVAFDDYGPHGSKKFRRLKEAFVTKTLAGQGRTPRECPARKRELLVMVEEGRKGFAGRTGTPSRYRLTGLLEAFD